ncbi:hypothetical protein QBC42DRAFT_85914 [Cladorrhinum samala]|uniref:HNH nuclease domain-containing protein n=1 Tax=Cladorrhinum samala TaxID=585594 RepID=A0AAV9HMG0_9PEZI|nr:hypothetical protein QBC42DRAFT_85914 [Cladorrhinum samala]
MSVTVPMDELYREFITTNAKNPRAMDELRRILTCDNDFPVNVSPKELLPIDALEIRLDLIRKVEDKWCKNFTALTKRPASEYKPFSDHQIAALMFMEFRTLEEMAYLDSYKNGSMFRFANLQAITCTLKIFVTKSMSQEEIGSAQAARPAVDRGFNNAAEALSVSSGDEEEMRKKTTKLDTTGKAKRNDYYKDKRRMLDQHQCIVTGMSNPAICHIIPYCANATEGLRELWGKCIDVTGTLGLVPPKDVSRLQTMFSSERGISDRHWNMISLCPTLHDWWGRGYFGLQYLGTKTPPVGDRKAPITLQVQLRWLMWRHRSFGEGPKGMIERTVDGMRAAFPELENPERPRYCGDHSVADGRPFIAHPTARGFSVKDGDVFEVSIEERHMEKMILAFELQWALIKLIAMAGGAETLDDADFKPDFLDGDWDLPGAKPSSLIVPLFDFWHNHERGEPS